MHDEDLQAVLASYETLNRGDIDATVAALAPDVEWHESPALPDAGGRPCRCRRGDVLGQALGSPPPAAGGDASSRAAVAVASNPVIAFTRFVSPAYEFITDRVPPMSEATLHTNAGPVTVELFDDDDPKTVQNF